MNLTDPELLALMNRADKQSRRAFLDEIGMLMRNGRPLPGAVSVWLGNVITAAAQGDSIDELLGARRTRGENPQCEDDRLLDQLIAFRMEREKRRRGGKNQAAAHLWEVFALDDSVLKRKHTALADLLRYFTDQQLDYEIEVHEELLGRER